MTARVPGVIAVAVLGFLCFGTVAIVAWRAEGAGPLGPADWRALSFTLRQASLSALLSVVLAVPVARALSRQRFRGRQWLLSLLGAPFLLPAIVAILGVLAVWGRSGWISDVLDALGASRLDIYGMQGVLLAHVMLNLPLAARMLLAAYDTVPAERWRLAAQLGITGWGLFRLLEWPALRRGVPSAAALVFAVCATSFAIALALGGGPAATTLELAIFEAALFEFNLGRAARLALLQFTVCTAAALIAIALVPPATSGFGVATRVERWDGRAFTARVADGVAIALAVLFLGLPLIAVVSRGLTAMPSLPVDVLIATGRSLGVAVVSMLLTLTIALPLAALAQRGGRSGALVQLVGASPLAASPFVVGIGLFIILNPLIAPGRIALPLVAIINAAMAVPYGLRLLTAALETAHAARGPLADALGLEGWTRARILYWPDLRAPLGLAAGLAAALSAGDLGVVALFSTPDTPTLPLLMYQLAGSRQIEAAHAAALILVALCFGLFAAFDRLGRA